MPTYNGFIAYLVEVLLHLLWCYAVFAIVLCVLLPAPLVVLWALSGSGVEVASGFMKLFASAPVMTFGWVHLAVFAVFYIYFVPRFLNAPSWLTTVITVVLGSVVLTLVSYVPFGVVLEADISGTFERTSFTERVGLSVLLTGFAVAVGALLLWFGGVGPFTYGLAKWLGWLTVGRGGFDAFVERERARLSREYDDYVNTIRKR